MKTQYYITLLATLLSACTHLINEPSIKVTSQNSVSSTIIEELNKMEIYETWGFTKQGQHIVINDAVSLKKLENLCANSRQGSVKIKTISSGKDTHTLSSLTNSAEGAITALDFRNGILHEYNFLNNTPENEVKESTIPLPTGQQHLTAVKGKNFILSTGLYENGRYLYYPLNGEEARYHLSYPRHPDYPDITPKTTAILYASTVLRLRPDEKAFVCADMYSGYIDFCSISGENIKRVKEIYLHAPRVHVSESPTIEVAYSRDNLMGFSDITVTPDRVYAIYSGKSYNNASINFIACQTLLEFDWEGNLLNTHTIDTPVINISHDAEENCIYALSYTPERSVVKIDLNKHHNTENER